HTRSKRDWSSDVCSSDLYRRRTARREDRVAGVFRGDVVLPAGKVLETARYRAAFEREFGQAGIDGWAGGRDEANIARRRAAITEIGRASCRERVHGRPGP